MKHIIILGDGMADLPVERLGGKTLLQYAHKPMMDLLAREGRCGRLVTVPEGFPPGSEVANTAILGYDLNKVYEGRGPLEAASIGYEMADDDFAIRCNIITLDDGKIITHNGGNLETDDARILIDYLNETMAKPINEREGCERVKFITGIQYRHLLVIKGGNKHIVCAPPHDHPNEAWRDLLVKPDTSHSTLHTPHSSADCRPSQRDDTEVSGAARCTSLQSGTQKARRAPGKQHLALERRLSSLDGDAHAAVSSGEERQRDFGCRSDSGHRSLCWTEDCRGGRRNRIGKHQLRRKSAGSY